MIPIIDIVRENNIGGFAKARSKLMSSFGKFFNSMTVTECTVRIKNIVIEMRAVRYWFAPVIK